MKVNSEVLGMLRQRKVVISAAVALFVLLIWVVAIFDPVSHKLSSVNTQVQAAQAEQATLQTRLDRLRIYSKESAQFEALAQRLSAAVPPTTDIYDYITAISNAASSTGVKVESIAPSTNSSAKGVTVIPVTVSATGTYGQTLAFIKALDALPRLTVIDQVAISGGGTGSSRGTQLTDQFNLDILAQPSATPTTSTSG